MRLLGRLFVLALVVLLMWPLAQRYVVTPLAGLFWASSPQRANLPEEAEQSTVFWLEPTQWLRFSLAENTPTLRILSHLQMLPEQDTDESLVRYAVDYRVLAKDDEVLKAGRYHYKAVTLPPRPLADGRQFPARFYDDPGLTPSAGENLFLDLASHPNAHRLELRAAHLPDDRNRIGVQVTGREMRSRADVGKLWPRLDPDTRDRLLRPHVYPPHLVSAFEIENALQLRWMPLGPEGVDGDDFDSDYLYTLSVPPAPPAEAGQALPPGLYADPDKWVTLPVDFEGSYRLEIQSADPLVAEVSVSLAHQRNQDLETRQQLLTGAAPQLTWTGELEPGLLQLIPSAPVTVRLFDASTGADVTPDKRYLQAHPVSADEPVRFALDPDSTEPQPVRLDVRTFSHPQRAGSGSEPRLRLEVRAADGAILQRFEQPISPAPSVYQRFSQSESDSRVSEGQSLFLEASPGATEVAVISNTPLLVTGYARLPGLPLVRELPESRRPWQSYGDRVPSWFLMNPVATGASGQGPVSLQWFFQPIERNEALLSGQYDWQGLDIQGSSLQRDVLFPHQLSGPLRATAVGSVFRALPDGAVSLELVPPSPGIPFRPELVYQRTGAQPTTVTVLKDGAVWLRRGIAGRTGRFSLPVVVPGRYRIEVQGDGRWFLNHNRPPVGAGYLQRSVYSLDGTGLTFELDKTETREVVNFDVVAPPGVDRFAVEVAVAADQRATGLLTDYSVLRRRFELEVQERTTLVLGTQSKPAAAPMSVALPLGEDLPPGRYRISVRPDRAGGLVSAYTVREGQRQTYRFFRRSLDGY